MKNIKKILAYLAIASILLLSVSMTFLAPSASASGISIGGNQGQSFTEFSPGESLTIKEGNLSQALTTTNDAKDFIIRVVNFALGFLGLIAVIIVIYGGVLYVTAAGEEERTQTGKKAIQYATIGLLIVLGSFAFVNTVIRGAGGDDEAGSDAVIGANTGSSFNAAAAQVRSIAEDIYSSFIFFAEINEEFGAIINDINKGSLSYKERLVPKADIQKALYSVYEKLNNIKNRIDEYTGPTGEINKLMLYIGQKIDEVAIAGTPVLAKSNSTTGKIDLCSHDSGKVAELKGYTGVGDVKHDPVQYVPVGAGGLPIPLPTCVDYANYSYDLYEAWGLEAGGAQVVLTMTTVINGDPSMGNVVDKVKEDTVEKTVSSLEELEDIKQALISTGVFGVAGADSILFDLFEKIMDEYGYETGKTTYASGKYLSKLNGWSFSTYYTSVSDLDLLGQQLNDVLEIQLEFADELEKLKSVIARLRASTVSGNAPLIVTFDVNESVDPAGGSLVGDNIDWTNIRGVKTFDGSIDVANKTAIEQAADCNYFSDDGAADTGASYSPTTQWCIFKYPGTYNATVTIKSNDPGKYLPGLSSLIIKVNPPATKINLALTTNERTGIPIMEYYEEEGIIKTDKNLISVTLDEAKAGLTFDATGTKNVKNYKWDFGNGEIIESSTDPKQTGVKYKAKGRYQIQLEVMNKQGEVDRKIFTLEVSDLAAYINMTPDSGISLGDSVTIDGSQSKSSSGPIKAYEWTITKPDGTTENLGADTNKPTFIYKFEEGGSYGISLTIISGSAEATTTLDGGLTIASQPPEAVLKHEIPDSGQPAVVHFDASSSFDPDGDLKDAKYTWTIKPDDLESWDVVNTTKEGLEDYEAPIVKFKKKGEYEVSLKVLDKTTVGNDTGQEEGEATQIIVIDNLLDVAWGEFTSTGILGKGGNEPGEAMINFKIDSVNGLDYEIDFGDGEEGSAPIDGSVTVPHVYTASGKYTVEATVYDDDDNKNTIIKNIYIGGGDTPVAKPLIFINGSEVYNIESVMEVSKKDILTFDASESLNTDGTGRNLKYSWDFGDTNKSSSKAATHSYDELSPEDPGYFTATLQVYDEDKPSKVGDSEVYIKVVNKAPFFSAIQAVPASDSSDLVSPVNIDVRAHGADDEDGSIIQYRWWYYDVDDPDEQLGVQVTKGSTARIVIGTTGKEGKEVTYGFGLEVTDSENKSVSSYDILQEKQIPTVTVTNGPNELPEAKFNVDTTTVFTGDSVRFTSASKDPDGTIKEYIWDVEGDGFHNNTPTDKSTLDHVYTIRDLEGYNVRLKVIDDKGGEDISDIITIYVDSLAEPPTAAFSYEVIEGSTGKKIKFTNNSTVDESAGAEILSNIWDFDTDSDFPSADSDGDGDLTNDTDAQATNPERLYTEYGTYTIKLTVTDNQGNTDEVTRTIKIPLADPPVAAFTYQVVKGEVVFQNNSSADTSSGAVIDEYIWDFDTASKLSNVDSDGDGVIDNDVDSDLPAPTKKYETPGIYKVKLTVVDNSGSEDSVVNAVDVSGAGTTTAPGDSTDLTAAFTTDPLPLNDGIVYLTGDAGSLKFDFTASAGAISYYVIDKNIYFDTDGNGIKDDDQDFKTTFPGTWKTNFEKAWGKTVAQLTVIDIYENKSTVTQEIKFQ